MGSEMCIRDRFESKLDTLTNSMLKMSDSLARLARPHGALLDSEEEDAPREEGGQSEFDPTERILSQGFTTVILKFLN